MVCFPTFHSSSHRYKHSAKYTFFVSVAEYIVIFTVSSKLKNFKILEGLVG